MTDRPPPDAATAPHTPATAADEDSSPRGYSEALAELESILRELDGEDVDVDVLGERVRRAAELLRFCRERISSARFEVEQVVAALETDEEPR